MVCIHWSSTAKQSSTGKHLEVTGISLLQQLEGAAPKSFFQAAG
jgi:hypothetical protein